MSWEEQVERQERYCRKRDMVGSMVGYGTYHVTLAVKQLDCMTVEESAVSAAAGFLEILKIQTYFTWWPTNLDDDFIGLNLVYPT